MTVADAHPRALNRSVRPSFFFVVVEKDAKLDLEHSTGSALRENDCNSILGCNMIMKIIIFRSFTVLTSYFTMLIVSGMYFSCGFHP